MFACVAVTVVNAPVVAVVAPTVPLMLMLAVPVRLVTVPLLGVPRAGVTSVGLVANTSAPEPVSSVTAAAKFAELGVPRKVATPVPKPLMPVDTGRPVKFVAVPLLGVPSAPPLTTNAPAVPVLTPSAVTTPVPVVVVLGAAPAPPPMTNALAASADEDANVPAAV